MVEVFKTNVIDQGHANMLADEIRKAFTDYTVNFDLEDCDEILRVKCTTGFIESSGLIDLLKRFGYHAEVLQDNYQPVNLILEDSSTIND